MKKDLIVSYEGKPSYEIHLRDSFYDFICSLEKINKNYTKVCIVSDSNVANLYMKELTNILENRFEKVISFVFEAGESSKNLAVVQKLYEDLIINHFDRQDLLIALGGGVVGDLCGYTAATYLRGIDFIQMPTTLLSQVDSSIGGKTGVDFLQYKNMVGAFYMPKLVYMNLGVLHTLPLEQFQSGMAEIIKHGLIADLDYYHWLIENKTDILSFNMNVLLEMIYRSCNIKREVVEKDPRELGIRAHLNFGHTIGHAIERSADFSLFHGQCVAIGIVSAAFLSKEEGWITEEEYYQIIETLKSFGLPVKYSFKGTSHDILNITKSDKKMVGNKIKFVVLKEIGNADIYREFSDEDILKSIEEVI